MKVSLNSNRNNNQNYNNVSFKGFYNNKALLKTLKFASKNGSHFSAAVTLALSTVARPISIMSTPKTDKENKKLALAKSLSSSVVGYLIMAPASMPVAKAIEKIDSKPALYLKKATIRNLKNGAESVNKSQVYMFATQLFKLGVGLLAAVPKSIITLALIPPIMGVMAKLISKKQTHDEVPKPRLTLNSKSKVISFKGLYNTSTEKLAKGIGKILDTAPVQKAAKRFCDTNFAQHIMSLTDAVITLSFVCRTAKSKNIEQKRKKPLIHNSLISTGLCISGGYGINRALKKPTEKFIKRFCEVNKDLPELEKYVEGIKIAKPVLILGVIYYIFIPLLATFAADRTGKSEDEFGKSL